MKVALVLRSGGIYTPKHATVLIKQIRQWLPFTEIICLTDMPLTDADERVPLNHGWPGWWSKMELFRPDLHGDLLFMDLDTLIVGPLDDIAAVNRLTLLRDFYRDGVYKGRPEGLGGGLMYLPEADRAVVWEGFMQNPNRNIQECWRGGDQQFFEKYYLAGAARWQDVVPGQVVSLKVHCANGVPSSTRVICAHGKPKFWDLPEYKRFYE